MVSKAVGKYSQIQLRSNCHGTGYQKDRFWSFDNLERFEVPYSKIQNISDFVGFFWNIRYIKIHPIKSGDPHNGKFHDFKSQQLRIKFHYKLKESTGVALSVPQ